MVHGDANRLHERMHSALSLRFPYHRARANRGRLALSVLAVALGVALVVAIQLMNAAVLAAFLDTIDGMAGRAALSIRTGEGLSFDESVLETVKAVPGVQLAVPLVTAVAFPDDGSGELLTVQGIDITNDEAVRVYHRGEKEEIVDDELTFLNSRTSVIATNEFAKRRGLKIGSQLPLVTPAGVQTFTVRGLLEPEGLAKTLGGKLIVMDLLAAEEAFTQRGQINHIDLVVEPGREEAVKMAVAERLPPGLLVEEPTLRKEIVRRTTRGLQGLLTAFAFLAVVAGFVVCYGRLAAVFEARTWETGLLRAVGLGRVVVFIELIKESLLVGLAGALLGIPLGTAIGWVGLPFVATATAAQFRLPMPAARPMLSWSAMGMGLAVGLLAAVLAALAPALRLARTPPIVALAFRGREVSAQRPDLRRWFVALVGATIALLVVVQSRTGSAALGTFTTSLFIVISCLIAQPLVQIGAAWLRRTWKLAFGPLGDVAVAHISQHSRRASLTTAALGVGLGTIGMFGLLAKSFETTLVAQVSSRLKADLLVTSQFVSGGWATAPLDEGVVGEIGSIDGVIAIAGEARRDLPFKNGTAVLNGYDPPCFRDESLCHWPLESDAFPDAMARVARGEGAIVSQSFARQFDIRAGQTVELRSPHGPQTIFVLGVTTVEPEAAIVMSRDLFKHTWNDTTVSWIHVATAQDDVLRTVGRSISAELGTKHRLQIRSGSEFIEYLAEQVRQAFGFLYLMEIVTFLLVVVSIGDALASDVLERRREFGVLRAVGLPRSRIAGLVLLEGLAIGLLGLTLASVVAATLGSFWIHLQFPALLGWSLSPHIPIPFLSVAVLLTLVLCLAGSLLPSIHATRLSVSAALRSD